MRRIATLVATGAVAAATAIGLAAGPAGADTTGTATIASGSTAATVASAPAGGFSADAAWHGWRSYDGYKSVYAHGSYKHTSKYTYVTGYVRDRRSGTYHAAVVLYFTQKGKSGYQWSAIVNPHHGNTVKFPATVRATYHTHFYVAEGLAKKVKGKGWVVTKVGGKHKVF